MRGDTAYVFTLFNSPNSGAFLQAWALGRVLRDLGCTSVSFVETGARKSLLKNYERNLRYAMKRAQVRHVAFLARKSAMYRRALRMLDMSGVRDGYGPDDVLVFGSDEVWNVSRENIASFPALWGQGVVGGAKVAYAPSANGARLSEFAGADDMRRSLLAFEALSARDRSTADAVSRLCGRDVEVVCDPTLLLGAGDYRRVMEPAGQSGYILVYSYAGQLSADEVAQVRGLARDRGLRLVSADNWLGWCDASVPCGPLGFLGLVDGAEAVVTDTFHGTAFATTFGKPFASFARDNAKVLEFLRSSRLDGRDASRRPLDEVMGEPVDWAGAREALDPLRERSVGYLRGALGR